jgi:hypothetical protein
LVDARADFRNHAGYFAAGNSRQRDLDWQARFFEPQIEMVQAARANRDNDFSGRGPRIWSFSKVDLARVAVSDELNCAHPRN